MRKSFKFRLYPTTSQIKRFEETFDKCRFLYNCALQERISFYKTFKKSKSYVSQANQLAELKALLPEFNNIHSQVLQSTLKRLDTSYQFFFKTKSGFPRFKNKDRFRSILYPQSGFAVKQQSGKWSRLFLSKIGHIPMLQHRNMEGKIKTCQIIKTKTNKWYVVLSCDNVPKEHVAKTNKSIGIDLGVKNYITTSNDEVIGNPKYLNKSLNKLKEVQKRLSKLSMKDKRRRATKLRLARVHEKIHNQREDFQHKVSKKLIEEYDQIFAEDLNIKEMKSFRNLNRAIGDCAWNSLIQKISYKAERANKKLVLIDPRNTSKMCSECGKNVDKNLSDRIHICSCRANMDRDLNAAINIFNRGMEAIPRKDRSISFELSRSSRL